MIKENYKESVAILIGTIIGGGVLGLPYAIAKAGMLIGALLILLIGTVVVLTHLMVAEMSLRTKGKHQLTGYMKQYLGSWGEHLMAIAFIIANVGALIAYIIGEGAILNSLMPVFSPVAYSLAFGIIASVIVIGGLKMTGKTEYLSTLIMLGIIILISFFTASKIDTHNLATIALEHTALPMGVILFASLGFVAVPSARFLLEKDKKKLKKAVLIGAAVPIFIYLIFSIIVVGAIPLASFESLGPDQRIATIALGIFVNPIIGMLANIFAMIALFTSFISIALSLMWMFRYDYNTPWWTAVFFSLVLPIVVAVSGFSSFIGIIAFSGAVGGGLQGILITLAHRNAKKRGDRKPEFSLRIPSFISAFIIAIFTAGIIYAVIY